MQGNKMNVTKQLFTLFTIAALHLPAAAEELSGKLTVFHAGSLSVPFKQMVAEFNIEHPNINVLLEAAGSRICARKISDLGRPCDVMASADYTVIDQLLIPKYTDWNIKFVANEMALVYHKTSRRSAEITPKNWYQILLDNKVAFGRSDPNADPCGYRAVLTMKLAGIHYNDPSIPEKLLQKNLNHIRPKETDLLALLESNEIDYLFLYRSVAQQHGLNFILLPNEINLKSTDFTDVYKKANVQISGKKPGEKITKTGAPMVYGITIPKNAPNQPAALAFVDFVLGEKGKKIMERCGQPSVVPATTSSFSAIPESLKKYAR